MNLLVGERISIATFKAQTTRHRIMGIINTDDMQIVFSDTPGVLKPNYKLQESMLNFSESALKDADVLLYVTDVVEKPDKNMDFVQKVQAMDIPVLLLINKIDLSNQEALGKLVEEWHQMLPKAEIIPISATARFNIDGVMKRIKDLLPDSPPYFEKDQWTDKPARFFVTEIIREKILLYYDKEIPYAVEAVVEQFKEDEHSIHINVVIYVERDTQKGIIIGKQGRALKKVATEARKSLEKFFGKSIYLEIFVKNFHCLQNVIKIQKRLALPHKNNVCNLKPRISLNSQDLLDYFFISQIPYKPAFSGCAKRTINGASDLRTHTCRQICSVIKTH